jgi:hypothetical protein
VNRTEPFETVWRDRLDPQRVHIPRSQYRNYIPRVDVFPLAVYDPLVIDVDTDLQDAIGAAFGAVNNAVSAVKPIGIKIPMRQLMDQIPAILSGNRRVLKVFSGGRVIKEVPIGPVLVEQCRRIRGLLLERLLLFEDMEATSSEATGGPTSSFDRSQRPTPHRFRRGGKVDALLRVVRLLSRDSQKVVVFVRNVSVCEAICTILLQESLNATYVHGDVGPLERRRRLDEFKNRDAEVLVATRQLFGRGFDLPEADAAVFYSPKESARTMWQEMLRIRGTVRRPKSVFILFYAWTAEASKLKRLVKGMLRTNASWEGYWFRWVYSELGEPEDREGTAAEQIPREEGHGDRGSVTQSFVRSLAEGIEMFRGEQIDQLVESLSDMAKHTGFLNVWPTELVRSLLFQLSETIVHFGKQKGITAKSIRRQMSKVFHPDKHLDATGVEKQFWHELFVALGHV